MNVEKTKENDEGEPLISGTIYHAFLYLSFAFLAMMLASQAIYLLKYKIHMDAFAIVLAFIFALLLVLKYDSRKKNLACKIPEFVVPLLVLVPTLLVVSLLISPFGVITSILLVVIAAVVMLEFSLSTSEASEV